MGELLKKIPGKTCWAITAKALWRLIMRGGRRVAPDLGIGEGAVALGLGKEKYDKINQKLWGTMVGDFYRCSKKFSTY